MGMGHWGLRGGFLFDADLKVTHTRLTVDHRFASSAIIAFRYQLANKCWELSLYSRGSA